MIYGEVILRQKTPLPPDYFILSILTTIFCLSPLGLVVIYFSMKTWNCLQRGAISMADRYSHVAFITTVIAVGVGFLAWMSLFIFLYSQQWGVLIYELHNLTHTFNITE